MSLDPLRRSRDPDRPRAVPARTSTATRPTSPPSGSPTIQRRGAHGHRARRRRRAQQRAVPRALRVLDLRGAGLAQVRLPRAARRRAGADRRPRGPGVRRLPAPGGPRHRPRQQDPRLRAAEQRRRHRRGEPGARASRPTRAATTRRRRSSPTSACGRSAADQQPAQGRGAARRGRGGHRAGLALGGREPAQRRATWRSSAARWATTPTIPRSGSRALAVRRA